MVSMVDIPYEIMGAGLVVRCFGASRCDYVSR